MGAAASIIADMVKWPYLDIARIAFSPAASRSIFVRCAAIWSPAGADWARVATAAGNILCRARGRLSIQPVSNYKSIMYLPTKFGPGQSGALRKVGRGHT